MRIPLKVQGVTDIATANDTALLIVTDLQEKKQIALVVNPHLRYEFAIRRGKYINDKEHSKIAAEHLETALPETMSAMIKYMTELELAVVIVGIFDGEYRAVLEDQRSGTIFAIRASDGILLSYADPHIPLYAEESLWERQSMPYMGTDAKGISMPLNTLSTDMLKQAMQKCIEEEKYEIADQLKKELDRRSDN